MICVSTPSLVTSSSTSSVTLIMCLCISHISTLITVLPTLSYVSIPPFYPCHLLTNLICYHTPLPHLSTIVTSSSTWLVIIRLYPTSPPLPHFYQLDLLSYVSIPPLYPCYLFTNLTCYHMSISHLSTLATFLPT